MSRRGGVRLRAESLLEHGAGCAEWSVEWPDLGSRGRGIRLGAVSLYASFMYIWVSALG